jgi:uncharacterized protein (DUF983 family)
VADPVSRNTKELTLPRLVVRGLLRRCPLCGTGGQFRTFFEKHDRCPRCHFPLKREEGHWIGALGMNTVVTFGSLAVTLAVSVAIMWDERRALPLFVACFSVAALVPILFFGSSQTLWSAIDLAMRPVEPDDDVDPQWLPPSRRRWDGDIPPSS